MAEFIPLLMFGVICLVLLAGFPVAFSLAGTALIFAGIGIISGNFDSSLLGTIHNRLFGDMTNTNLVWQYPCLFSWEYYLRNLI